MVKGLIRVVAHIQCVENGPKDLLGQTGQSIGILEFLGSDPCRCELGLDEAEPNVWFLLMVGAKFNLRNCCRSDRVGQVFTSHGGRFGKCRCSPKSCGTLVKGEAGIDQKRNL